MCAMTEPAAHARAMARRSSQARAPPPTPTAPTSPSGRPTRTRSGSACSTTTAARRGSSCASTPSASGTATCRGVRPGQRYGFRVDGAWDPHRGPPVQPRQAAARPVCTRDRRRLSCRIRLCAASTSAGQPNPGDTAPYTPRCVVVGRRRLRLGRRPPARPCRGAIRRIYEAHVTRPDHAAPRRARSSCAAPTPAVAHPAVTGYLRDLGVTAVELLPVHHFVSEPSSAERGLTNYWGYNSIGFFAPHAGYSSSGTRGRADHRVQADGQGPPRGRARGDPRRRLQPHRRGRRHRPDAVASAGYDDGSYYRTDGWGRYADVTGCGNTVHVSEPQVLQLVMDSLRYWVTRDARRRLPVRPGVRPAPQRRRTSTCTGRSSPPSTKIRCCARSS